MIDNELAKGNPERRGDWFQTYTGKEFYILDPRPEDICIEDIAHALSLQCRFNGMISQFYSVAQHSVHVSQLVPREFALWGLMHDAAEAYMGDIVTPLKRSIREIVKPIEMGLMKCVCERFDMEAGWFPMPAVVLGADQRMLLSEARDLLGPQTRPWGVKAEPVEWKVEPWDAPFAEKAFLLAFDMLGGKR